MSQETACQWRVTRANLQWKNLDKSVNTHFLKVAPLSSGLPSTGRLSQLIGILSASIMGIVWSMQGFQPGKE